MAARKYSREENERAWDAVMANKGVVVTYIATRQPWICKRGDLYDDALDIGLDLARQAMLAYDAKKTTVAGWIISWLDAQLLRRVREFQGLAGLPKGSFSLDESEREYNGRPFRSTDLPDPRANAHSTPESRAWLGARLHEEIANLRAYVARRPMLPKARRAVMRALIKRALGDPNKAEEAIEEAEQRGISRADLIAIEKAWRPS